MIENIQIINYTNCNIPIRFDKLIKTLVYNTNTQITMFNKYFNSHFQIQNPILIIYQ